MSDTAPAVALLFDDTELGRQLRDALHERGARIVHEGDVSGLSRDLLQQVGADVLVVNLDDSADDALDHLYEVIDGDRPRVVFNDAQASRALVGWDRARWARHLAVKVLAGGDVDPPRPSDARDIEAAATVLAEPVAGPMEVPAEIAAADMPVQEAAASTTEPNLSAHDDSAHQHEQIASAESENLAAELEALLASGDLPEDDDESGSGLRYTDDEALPPLHDGDFGASTSRLDAASTDSPDLAELDGTAAARAAVEPAFQLDHLQLSPLTDASVATIPATAQEPGLAAVDAAATSARAPASWALLDEDAAFAASVEKPDATAFGVEKLSAADFLAPDIEQVAPGLEPVMGLELVSMEEAIAPQAYAGDHVMLLDDLDSALKRVILLGAAVSSMDSVCVFLAALPAGTRLTFLHTQHAGAQSDAELVTRLAAHCALPVRLLEQGSRAGAGEVLVVPSGQQVRLRRDGSLDLQSSGADTAQGPSIDASFTMAANAFGRDALAIVFAGRANDAVAGAQAVHDRGGQVWVESSSGEHFADMVSGIFAERLVSFSGTPPELAAHLIEVFP